MKTALIQISSSDDPAANLDMVLGMIAQAAAAGAEFILTPEVTNCISTNRAHQLDVLHPQDQDITLAGLRAAAQAHGVWLLIGSLALKAETADVPFVNRSFLVAPDGGIAAQYDKIHMFDVDLQGDQSYRESAAFHPGDRAVLAQMPFGGLGMTICYDLRFPYLYRHLAQSGAQVITVPAAFSPATGAAHWHVLLRARAIETGAYILAPAQCGTHAARSGTSRRTYGHSLIVAPWGEVLAEAGTDPCILYADLDMAQVQMARSQVPSLRHDRDFMKVPE
jgi:predicted amidohydrolase